MITTIEELSLGAWPAFEEQVYDGWILRFAEGYTKRANSVNPLYPSTISLDKKIAHCEIVYSQKGLPPVFKLTGESSPPVLDRALAERGYGKLDETSVRTVSLGNGYPAGHDIDYYSRVCDEWVMSFARCSGIGEANTVETLTRILGLIQEETIFAYIKRQDRIAACGLGVLDRGYLGCFDIVVDTAYRGMGYGRRIMDGLLAQGAKRGAATAYLQVVMGNLPAEELYDSLGFQEMYRYWYRKK